MNPSHATPSRPGGVRYWAAFGPGEVDQTLVQAQGEYGTDLIVVDLTGLPWRPWAPFVDLALRSGPLRSPRPYFRHAHLFEGLADPSEPLVDEELAYEMGRLADALVDRLPGQAVFVRHAELLGAEALYLAERFRENPRRPLGLWLCFESLPRNPGPFEHLDTLGYLTWVGTPPLSGPSPAPSNPVLPGPSAAQRQELLRWLCFETLAGVEGDEAAPDRLEALAAVGGFELGIDLGESLVRRASLHPDPPELRRLWVNLARLYRQAGDPASAARCLTLGWKQARDSADRAGLARFDFLLFETSYRSLVVEDVYLGLEERLAESLETLGWVNHLAYVLTKNVWVQTVGRTQGWDRAWALWSRGRALVRRSGNRRRLSVSLQTLGSLRAIAGDLAGALASTRRAVHLARVHSSPLHTAKVENGLGYLYFSGGEFSRAWSHHSRALRLLPETRDHQEYIGTLVNLGRLYLFNEQADRALPLLTMAVRAMDSLGLADLPFHPRSNTYALLGACCLKTGQGARATEFVKKIRADEARNGRPNEHRICLEALVAEASGDRDRAERLSAEALALLVPRVGDQRHLLVWFHLELGRWLSRLGDGPGAAQVWDRAEGWIQPPPLGADERRHLRFLRSGGGTLPVLAEVSWDSPLLVRFTRQEAALRNLRRTVQDYGFLQTWHQDLLPGIEEEELFRRAVSLVRTHFPVDTVAILDGTQPRLLALAPGSDPLAARRVCEELSRPGGDPGFPLVAVFPLVHSGQTQARLVCVDPHPEPIFGPGDTRVLELAADHLSILLLGQRKNLDLEERGAHLARALEVLGETQERLVRSENLAVLGNLSASLAHELNTPLGAILSAARTVQGLLSGPLATLWDEASSWPGEDRDVFRQLVGRLVGREASLAPVDRADRRALRQTLTDLGIADAGVQADLWFEVGLGSDLDLQQTLASQEGIVRALERTVPLAQGHRLARVMEEAALRAGAVVASLKSYLQGASDEAEAEFSLVEALESTMAVLGTNRWRNLQVVWDIDLGLQIRGRRLSLSQVWTNLIQNAIQAMEGKGTLTLSAHRGDNGLQIEVGDTGPGIPEEHQAQVLQPFFSTKKQTGGLGLGLDICRRIVEGHQGRLSFESRPGCTVFRVNLPSSAVVHPGVY